MRDIEDRRFTYSHRTQDAAAALRREGTITPKALAEELGVKGNVAGTILARLVDYGVASKTDRGFYAACPTPPRLSEPHPEDHRTRAGEKENTMSHLDCDDCRAGVTAFHCQAADCQIVLIVPAAAGRGTARSLGWSVASDDFGSQSVCPLHRADRGRN